MDLLEFFFNTFMCNNILTVCLCVVVWCLFVVLCFTPFPSTNVVMNYSEIESKVREATNDDPWGPSGQLMGEIAK